MRSIWLLFLLTFTLLFSASAEQSANLIPDPSFEAPTPSWFNEKGGTDYYLVKSQIADAPEGKQVLGLSAWNLKDTKVLSPIFDIPAGKVTLTFFARAIKPVAESKLAVALFDETGEKELGRFVEVSLNDITQWRVLSGSVTAFGGKVRLALLPSGPVSGAAIELDKIGLFPGANAGEVTNDVDWQLVEAESLANGTSWKSLPHYAGWYSGMPLGGALLAGYDGVQAADNAPVVARFEVRHAGSHILWVRVLYTIPEYKGAFTVTISQNGKTVAARTIDSSDATISPQALRFNWVWVPVNASLDEGTALATISRPDDASTGTARNIDAMLLTNLTYYQPDVADLNPRLYVRWTNTGNGAPYCLWGFVRRNADPWYSYPGILSAVGLSGGISVPEDKDKWVGPGQSTPWSDLSPFLTLDGKFNRVQFTATRVMHTSGLVEGNIKGTLEFSVGADKKIVHTVKFDQDAPRIRLAIPGDFLKLPINIQTGYDALKLERAAVTPTAQKNKLATHLDLVTDLGLQRGLDDPALLGGEFEHLVNMGFNGTYAANNEDSHPETTKSFYHKYGMQTRFGIEVGTWYMTRHNDPTQPDIEKISQGYKALSTANAAIMPDVVRLKLADEPGGPSYEELAKSDSAQQQFRKFLQQRKVPLGNLNAASWDQVKTVTEKEMEAQPTLFYYSGLFRLYAVADLAKTLVAEKKKYFPDNVKTYVDYAPPFSWVERGVDPFLTQRDGGFEMGWSEDWPALFGSPQYTADTYALLRAAGPGQPLGGYMVAATGNPLLQRLKYYTMVAGGARQICVYSYGPEYVGLDSWSDDYDLYPVLRDVQFELGNIDEAFNGTKRRPAQIAILYNRTAALWSGSDTSAEQDLRYLRWALAHEGYDVDILPEEDIAAGKLDQYKALYLGGIQLRDDVSPKIADWVRKGGVLFGSAGAATRDQFNQPNKILADTFGAQSINLKMVEDAGRPKYELRTQKVLETLQSTGLPAPVLIDQICYSETLQPSGAAKVLFKGKTGAVMGTENAVGKGTAIRLAALPGLAYLNHAIRGKTYNPETYLPQDYDPAQRSFLSLPARLAKVNKVAQSNLDISEISRYDAPGRSVLFVVNYGGQEKKDFSMLVPNVAWASKAFTADGAKAVIEKAAGGMTRVTFPLNVAGAVVLQK